jgi:tetratricopeptide (TPR) repeat protein
MYEKLEQFDQAEIWRRKWLAVVQERSGADSVAYATAQSGLGSNLLAQQKWQEAETALRQSLAIREEKQPDDWTTFNTKSLLGGALAGQQKYTQAEPLLLEAYRGLKERESKIPKDGLVGLTPAVQRLVDFYDATDRPAEAEQWRKLLPSGTPQ